MYNTRGNEEGVSSPRAAAEVAIHTATDGMMMCMHITSGLRSTYTQYFAGQGEIAKMMKNGIFLNLRAKPFRGFKSNASSGASTTPPMSQNRWGVLIYQLCNEVPLR